MKISILSVADLGSIDHEFGSRRSYSTKGSLKSYFSTRGITGAPNIPKLTPLTATLKKVYIGYLVNTVVSIRIK